MSILKLLDGVSADTTGDDFLVSAEGGVNLVISGNLGGGTVSIYEKSGIGQALPAIPVYFTADGTPKKLAAKAGSVLCATLSSSSGAASVLVHAITDAKD